nr:unnamed protein product [Callosobruchus analis]
MRSTDCTPVSSPPLPPTYQHPMWNAWDLALDLSLGQLPAVVSGKAFKHLPFFEEQLTAFQSCQAEIVRDGGHKYFLSILQDTSLSSEHRTQAAFVLASIVRKYREGQEAALQGSLVSVCLEQLNDPSPELRQWVAICLGQLWDHYEKAKWTGVRDIAHEKDMLRAADDTDRMKRVASSSAINNMGHQMTQSYTGGSMTALSSLSCGSVCTKIWTALCALETDPFPHVAKLCITVTGYIKSIIKEQLENQDNRSNNLNSSSMSLPPSPNRGNYFSGRVLQRYIPQDMGLGTGAKTTLCQNRSTRMNHSKVTALEWINAHDTAMLMVAADDGTIKLWKPCEGTAKGPTLISAWQAFTDLKPPVHSGIVMLWEQWTQTLITSGDTRLLRFWDAECELKAFDIPTGTDSSVTCIDSTYSSICHEWQPSSSLLDFTLSDENGCLFSEEAEPAQGPRTGLCVAGCADGSVRLFDRRCPSSEARIKVWMEHPGKVLAVQMRDNLVISGR